jgi:outer membrane lipoprotein-sorting protein
MIRALFALLLSTSALAAEPTIEELLVATDDIQRGDSSSAVMKMEVKTARYERAMKMKALSKGTENSLITILEPAKDSGVSTLKVGDNLWNYLPKVDRTMKVPSGMMGGSWMGSHFSNDDLVKESRLSEDFTASFAKKPSEAEPDQPYVIDLVPKPDAPVVWGKVEVTVTADKLPVSVRYFDEKGTLMRTMDFKDVQDVSGRKVPMVMQLTPADKPGEYTRVTYEELAFDVDLPDKTFTVQALKGR